MLDYVIKSLKGGGGGVRDCIHSKEKKEKYSKKKQQKIFISDVYSLYVLLMTLKCTVQYIHYN